MKFSKINYDSIYLSDLCLLGGFFVRGRLVKCNLLSRKYEGLLYLNHKPYHVYIRYGFYSGAQITGIAVPAYPDFESAFRAGGDLGKAYKKYIEENYNRVYTRRKVKNFYCFITGIITLAVILLYIERMLFVCEYGMNMASMILSIFYPLIVALCYYVRSRCQ